MKNINFINEMIKKHGIIKFQRMIISLLTEGYAHWDEIEEWAFNFNWLSEDVPEDIYTFLTKIKGDDENVQLPENNE